MKYDAQGRFETSDADIRPGGARVTHRGRIDREIIDINGHMNVSGFDILFDQGEHNLFAIAGIWEPWVAARQQSLFRLEKVIRYENELLENQPFEVRSRVIATNGRLIHHFHELWNCANDRRSAMFDALSIHVDLRLRKSCQVDDPEVLDWLFRLEAEAAPYGPPANLQPRSISGRNG